MHPERLHVALAFVSAIAIVRPTLAQGPRSTAPAAPPTITSVAVLPTGDAVGDSVHAIVARALSLPRRLALVGPESSPSYVLASTRRDDRVRFTLIEAGTQAVVREGEFPIQVVPPDRAAEIHAAAVAEWALADSAARAAAWHNTVVQDSLRQVRAARARRGRRAAREVATLDSLLASTSARDVELRAEIDALAARRDSAIRVLLARDAAARESAARARRWALYGAADEIHSWITGTRGLAQTRVVYVSRGRLRIIDADGGNDRELTQTGVALSPSWHPSGRYVVFSELTSTGTRIVELDVTTGARRYLGDGAAGLNITPVYSRDGRYVMYSSGGDGRTTNLVLLDPHNGTRLGHALPSAVEASSPTFGPGRAVAYVSPRVWQRTPTGVRAAPQIVLANLDSLRVRPMVGTPFGIRSYRTGPDWSPDGAHIAYTEQVGRFFQVALFDTKSGRARTLTATGENEDPSWAPDAQHLAITSTRGGSKDIWILDVVTNEYRRLTTTGDARLAAWSPVLPLLPESAPASGVDQ